MEWMSMVFHLSIFIPCLQSQNVFERHIWFENCNQTAEICKQTAENCVETAGNGKQTAEICK